MLNKKINGKFECIKDQGELSNFMRLGKVYEIKDGVWTMEDGNKICTHATTVNEFNCCYNTQIKKYIKTLDILELEEGKRYKDEYDIEYEFENGKLYVLTCNGRTESLKSFNTVMKMKFIEVEIDKIEDKSERCKVKDIESFEEFMAIEYDDYFVIYDGLNNDIVKVSKTRAEGKYIKIKI